MLGVGAVLAAGQNVICGESVRSLRHFAGRGQRSEANVRKNVTVCDGKKPAEYLELDDETNQMSEKKDAGGAKEEIGDW